MTDQEPLNMMLLAAASSAHTRRWADALTGLGHHVTVASWHPGPEIPGANVHVAPAAGHAPAWRLPLAAPWLRRLVRDSRPDVIHVHSLGAYAALSLALPPGPARVLSPYGGDLRAARRSAARAAMVRLAMRRADMVLPCSAELGAEVAARYAVPPQRMQVLSWGVAETLIRAQPSVSPEAVRAEFGIPASATVVLSMRSTSATYRTLEVVSAFADAAAGRAGLYLVVLSGGRVDQDRARRAQQDYLDRVGAAARRLAGQVLIVERTLSHLETFSLMCASDVAVSIPPQDQHSYSVLEAALAGCRLLLSDIPPYQEMISAGLAADMLAEPIGHSLAERLRVADRDEYSRRRNRQYILTCEHGAAKLADHDQLFHSLSRHREVAGLERGRVMGEAPGGPAGPRSGT